MKILNVKEVMVYDFMVIPSVQPYRRYVLGENDVVHIDASENLKAVVVCYSDGSEIIESGFPFTLKQKP
jgi:hypothetical protein